LQQILQARICPYQQKTGMREDSYLLYWKPPDLSFLKQTINSKHRANIALGIGANLQPAYRPLKVSFFFGFFYNMGQPLFYQFRIAHNRLL
jgi:hypothetical protein